MNKQKGTEKGTLAFVVQKHRARALHYDFRLEAGGVMPSWSIPKGPTLDPSVKRLALPTEDHPLDYRHFEGVIQEGGYGAGPVMIWDEGTYAPETETAKGIWEPARGRHEADEAAKAGIARGELKFRVYGKKLQGSFALVRTGGLNGRPSWLLIKHRDMFSAQGYDPNDLDFSAVTGRTLEHIAGGKPPFREHSRTVKPSNLES